MIDISLDKSRVVRIKARARETSVPKVFTFTQGGEPFDISSFDFKLYVQKRSNSQVKLFTLSIGDGLTIQGDDNNQLLVSVSASRATQTADTYFFRLFSVAEDHTWLNGPFEFYNGESDSEPEDTPIVINPNGDTIVIEITGGESGIMTFDQQ